MSCARKEIECGRKTFINLHAGRGLGGLRAFCFSWNRLLVINVFIGAEGGTSDHPLVVAKIRCLKRWSWEGGEIEGQV